MRKKNQKNFFNTFERLIKDLKNAGATVDWKRKLAYLVMALPDNLDHNTETLDLIPKENKNVHYIRQKFITKE